MTNEQTQNGNNNPATPGIRDDVAEMAVSIFKKARKIKKDNPEISKEIDRIELDIRDKIAEVKEEIDRLDQKDQELVTVLVVNGIQRTAEEVLIGEPVETGI